MNYEPGQTVGHWTLLRYLKSTEGGRTANGNLKNPRWVCQCSCGMIREVQTTNLRNGQSRSCGCQAGFGNRWRKMGLGRITDVNRSGPPLRDPGHAASTTEPATHPVSP